ncbi:UNVERIFIED_CONTAM: hypothetical protein PYX00_003735 [Menopon gallinae]|uniref:Uncharacterized protein n=1 Tax=Menopon gallinae TaxID=328185 RepID=A0AAW2I1K6_9NEOP
MAAQAKNLTTILEREESIRSLENVPKPIQKTTFTYVPDLHPPPKVASPVYSTVVRKEQKQEVALDMPPIEVRPVPIKSLDVERIEERTTELVEKQKRKAPPPPSILPYKSETIQQTELIEPPVVVSRRPEITSHVVDDVFLRTITEKKTIEDIERHKRLVTEYHQKQLPPPKVGRHHPELPGSGTGTAEGPDVRLGHLFRNLDQHDSDHADRGAAQVRGQDREELPEQVGHSGSGSAGAELGRADESARTDLHDNGRDTHRRTDDGDSDQHRPGEVEEDHNDRVDIENAADGGHRQGGLRTHQEGSPLRAVIRAEEVGRDHPNPVPAGEGHLRQERPTGQRAIQEEAGLGQPQQKKLSPDAVRVRLRRRFQPAHPRARRPRNQCLPRPEVPKNVQIELPVGRNRREEHDGSDGRLHPHRQGGHAQRRFFQTEQLLQTQQAVLRRRRTGLRLRQRKHDPFGESAVAGAVRLRIHGALEEVGPGHGAEQSGALAEERPQRPHLHRGQYRQHAAAPPGHHQQDVRHHFQDPRHDSGTVQK